MPSTAVAQTTVKIDSVKVDDWGGGNYNMTAKGTITVDKDHTIDGLTAHIEDPQGKILLTTIALPFTPPEPGKTTGIEYSASTTTKANGYRAYLSLEYKDENNVPRMASDEKFFNVP